MSTLRRNSGTLSTSRKEIYLKIKSCISYGKYNFPELERDDIRLMGVNTGRRRTMYFHCELDSSLNKFIELTNTSGLYDTVQKDINKSLETDAFAMKTRFKLKDVERNKEYFQRPVGE